MDQLLTKLLCIEQMNVDNNVVILYPYHHENMPI